MRRRQNLAVAVTPSTCTPSGTKFTLSQQILHQC
jgi:hypothetical protein